MRAPVRIALVVLGLAVTTYGTATLTGGWLWVPSHQPTERPEHLSWRLLDNNGSPGSPSVAAPALKDSRTVSDFGWPLLWYERTEERFIDIDACLSRGRPSAAPLLYVVTTTGPRPGTEWISGGVVAAGLALAAFGAWPRRRRTDVSP